METVGFMVGGSELQENGVPLFKCGKRSVLSLVHPCDERLESQFPYVKKLG